SHQYSFAEIFRPFGRERKSFFDCFNHGNIPFKKNTKVRLVETLVNPHLWGFLRRKYFIIVPLFLS
ncbi:MAG: hypothetical protein LBG31_04125, partial [Prevotellaceae bacterium]|nr:hypothetical protein [Prevotellaceae bacterium]